ncbi:hypothetical protein NM208_g3389 [Fusarium decemcellulare]|uniref:Uncharacterized protein n=1 Tax=Fusarium decemcellulare TaxID=57161 RepID=A0ACC1SPI2_9HYPO|nr:hypothetical protein NM208_g3389 [Fusarium decemcellulare]
MSEQRDSVVDKSNVIEAELLTADEDENYQGLTLKCVLVYLSIVFACAAQILAVVATGAFSRNIAAVVGGQDRYIWVPQGLIICTTFTAAPIAQLSDFWGRRLPILICTALCIIGSILIARTVSMTMAIVGALLVGVGSGSTSLLYAVASEIMPRRYRSIAQAGVNVANSFGGILTLLVGFACIKKSDEGFRVVWYIDTGLFAVNFLAILFLFKPPKRPLEVSLTLRQKLKALDWTNAHVLSTFIVGVAFIVFTVIWEVKKKDGFCHHGLFETSRNFALALVFIFVEGFTFFAINNFLPLEFSLLFESDQFKVGVLVSIIFIGGATSSMAACMATLQLGQSTSIWGFTILAGLGLGFGLVIAVTTGQISTPPGLIAVTSGLILTARSLGGSVSLPIYTAILNSLLSKNLGPEIADRVLPLGLSADDLPAFIRALSNNDQRALASIPGINPDIISAGLVGLRTAYRIAFRGIWSAAAAVSAVGFILALFVTDPRKSFNMHVDAPVEHELALKLHEGLRPTETINETTGTSNATKDKP